MNNYIAAYYEGIISDSDYDNCLKFIDVALKISQLMSYNYLHAKLLQNKLFIEKLTEDQYNIVFTLKKVALLPNKYEYLDVYLSAIDIVMSLDNNSTNVITKELFERLWNKYFVLTQVSYLNSNTLTSYIGMLLHSLDFNDLYLSKRMISNNIYSLKTNTVADSIGLLYFDIASCLNIYSYNVKFEKFQLDELVGYFCNNIDGLKLININKDKYIFSKKLRYLHEIIHDLKYIFFLIIRVSHLSN